MRYREDHITTVQGGSYAWLSDPAVGLRSWFLSDDRVYWIQGKPGSGKSTLMRYLSRNLDRIFMNDASKQFEYLWFFFYARGSYLQKSFEGLLRSVLYQLGQANPSIAQIIGDQCKAKDPGMRNTWTDGELMSIFELVREQITVERPVVLFLDALDEFNGYPETMADFLSSLSSSTGPTKSLDIKICFSSRPWDVFVERFDKCCGIRLQDWTRADIVRYADVRIQKILDPAPFDSPTQPHRERMVNYIQENAQGVFLWVNLVLDELAKISQRIPQNLYAEMTKFPADLEDYYRFTLDRIPPKDKYDAFILLELVLRRGEGQVELGDLYYALRCAKGATFEACQQFLRGARAEMLDEASMETQLKDLCGGLLEIVQVNWDRGTGERGNRSIVQFMHQTAKEFVSRPDLRQRLSYGNGQALVWMNGHHFWTHYWFASAKSFSHDTRIGNLLCEHSCLAEYTGGNHFGTFLDTVPECFFSCQRSECIKRGKIWIGSRLSFAAVSGLQLYISHKLADEAKKCSDGPALLLNSDQTSPLAHMICSEINRRCILDLSDGTSLTDASLVATLQMLIHHGLRLQTLVNGELPLEQFFYYWESVLFFIEADFPFFTRSTDFLATVLNILLSAGCSPETALMHRTELANESSSLCLCRPLHINRDARLTRVLLNHRADPDSFDQEGHTPLDRRVALCKSATYRLDFRSYYRGRIVSEIQNVALLIGAGGHLSRDAHTDFKRLKKEWLQHPRVVASTFDEADQMVKLVDLIETAPVLQKRPTRRELKAMYPERIDGLLCDDAGPSKPKSSSLRGLFRRFKT